ncbi:unnamed protein product [Sphagnum jensenii]|uniref:Uncharacterized protein n=1 Tax=Sphagnum jensenii TaxID=128206 RepID=A0ABP1B8L8_9BRYO
MLQREGGESEEEQDSSSDHTASKDSFETCYESIFADLTPESLPEFVNVRELLSDIESELGEQACQFDPLVANCELPEEVNVRELLAEIQEELDEPYFDKFFSTCNEDSSVASQLKRYHNDQATTSNADIVTSEEEEGTSFRVSPRNDDKAADTSSTFGLFSTITRSQPS